MRPIRAGLLMSSALLSLVCLSVGVPPASAAPAPAVRDCSAAEHRRLDFKVGEFDVTGMEGAKAGVSRVESVLGGCMLVEHWQGAISGFGQAFFYYDREGRRWHTTFVNDDGYALVMSGVFEGDTLVVRGTGNVHGFDGEHRMAWSPSPDGGVKQLWEHSPAAGGGWKTIHIGHYARRR
jgi:hypothetical protein